MIVKGVGFGFFGFPRRDVYYSCQIRSLIIVLFVSLEVLIVLLVLFFLDCSDRDAFRSPKLASTNFFDSRVLFPTRNLCAGYQRSRRSTQVKPEHSPHPHTPHSLQAYMFSTPNRVRPNTSTLHKPTDSITQSSFLDIFGYSCASAPLLHLTPSSLDSSFSSPSRSSSVN